MEAAIVNKLLGKPSNLRLLLSILLDIYLDWVQYLPGAHPLTIKLLVSSPLA